MAPEKPVTTVQRSSRTHIADPEVAISVDGRVLDLDRAQLSSVEQVAMMEPVSVGWTGLDGSSRTCDVELWLPNRPRLNLKRRFGLIQVGGNHRPVAVWAAAGGIVLRLPADHRRWSLVAECSRILRQRFTIPQERIGAAWFHESVEMEEGPLPRSRRADIGFVFSFGELGGGSSLPLFPWWRGAEGDWRGALAFLDARLQGTSVVPWVWGGMVDGWPVEVSADVDEGERYDLVEAWERLVNTPPRHTRTPGDLCDAMIDLLDRHQVASFALHLGSKATATRGRSVWVSIEPSGWNRLFAGPIPSLGTVEVSDAVFVRNDALSALERGGIVAASAEGGKAAEQLLRGGIRIASGETYSLPMWRLARVSADD